MKETELFHMRRDYISPQLNRKDMPIDPFTQFEYWFKEAQMTEQFEPNTMILATVGNDLKPSVRVVLLKKFSSEGFVFFTNYLSKKGMQIGENPKVGILFFWSSLMRQIRVEGDAMKISESDSDEYFDSRPVESRATAVISKQSSVVDNRETLEVDFINLMKNSSGIKRPDNWGGYIVKPVSFEFWQGGTNRFHDRFLYTAENGQWNIERLSP